MNVEEINFPHYKTYNTSFTFRNSSRASNIVRFMLGNVSMTCPDTIIVRRVETSPEVRDGEIIESLRSIISHSVRRSTIFATTSTLRNSASLLNNSLSPQFLDSIIHFSLYMCKFIIQNNVT